MAAFPITCLPWRMSRISDALHVQALPFQRSLDILTVEYPDPHALMRHLQNGRRKYNLKRRAYVPRATIDAAAEKYVEMFGNSDGSIPATFQVIYATGWKPAESRQTSSKDLPKIFAMKFPNVDQQQSLKMM